MHRGYGFQKQSYAMHQESSWQSSNGGSASAMHIVPDLLYSNVDSAGHHKHHSNFEAQRQSNGRHAQNMHQSGWSVGGGGSSSAVHHHHKHHASSGGKKLPLMSGGFHGSNFSEAATLNNALGSTGFVYEEVHGSTTTPAGVSVQETTYAHSSWGGDNGHNYCNNFDEGIHRKRNVFKKVPWISKGL
ncbi:hypothetical protein FNV43_RR25920 [Rhamnella rubrinervis]|uniref:Uncharacterized protein n=1 Tax=Rhamnella rubrinervis TaxID=2594499 RepID=A0A8K0DNU2_9ROSA|nr:hypothetical protein FNV43_RR25920 [Rhamnella rubrinervis]